MAERRTQEARRAETRAALIGAARRLFVERGVADVGTPEIVRAAGVTRGALYHHFDGKTDLFRAVARVEADAVGKAIAEAASDLPADDALAAGTRAYLGAMEAPGRARLLLVEAQAALGPQEALALLRSDGGAELRAGLAAALPGMEAGALDALTDLVSAALDRAALRIAEGAPRAEAEAAALLMLERLTSLRGSTGPSRPSP